MKTLIDPQTVTNSLWLIPAFPLAGAVINGLLRRRLPSRVIHVIGCASVFVAFLVAVAGFFALVGTKEPHMRGF
jgi:NADH-quinone oxidoreductase subunit L